MSEAPDSNIPDNPIPEQLPPSGEHTFEDEALRARWDSAEELRAAHRGWLERRGIDPTPATTPHLTMGRREFDLFRNAPPNYLDYTWELYKIPQSDQEGRLYALVDIEPTDPNLPPEPELVIVKERDFGTIIEREAIDEDFQSPDSSPDSPTTPESGGTYRTVNIADTLIGSAQGVEAFAAELMKETTVNPLSGHYGDVGIRAGGLTSRQKDAYVWTTSPFTKSVELTIAFPSQYDSVCVVRGEKREAANGKADMAQIVDPVVVLKIEGKNLTKLQGIYHELYREPDFALTEVQRRARDETFNNYLARQISHQANSNRDQEQARQDDEYRRNQPQLRARDLPRS